MQKEDSLSKVLTDYTRIAKAIAYISANFKSQPELEEIAREINLSPFHFQRMFTEWAGVSPKKFIQYLSVEYAKTLLQSSHSTLADAAFEAGLSGTGRLHDLFITIEGMTPGEFKNGGENLEIMYSFQESFFGKFLVASTQRGICYLAFTEDEQEAVSLLRGIFPNALFENTVDLSHKEALAVFSHRSGNSTPIKMHLKGTPFQLKVWNALLRIPMGGMASYGAVARAVNLPTAARAVGSAIADNPVAFLIPCHRVIQATGKFGHYHWGPDRKTAMLGWEAARPRL